MFLLVFIWGGGVGDTSVDAIFASVFAQAWNQHGKETYGEESR